jgi:hypothetical protein
MLQDGKNYHFFIRENLVRRQVGPGKRVGTVDVLVLRVRFKNNFRNSFYCIHADYDVTESVYAQQRVHSFELSGKKHE